MASSVRQAHTRFTAGKAPRRQRTLKHESHEKGRNPRNTRHPLSCPSLPFVSFVIQTSLHNRDLLLHQPTQLNRQHVSLRASTESLSPLKPLRSLKPLQCDHSSQCLSGSPPSTIAISTSVSSRHLRYPSRSTSHRHSRSKSRGESWLKGRVRVVRVIGGWVGSKVYLLLHHCA